MHPLKPAPRANYSVSPSDRAMLRASGERAIRDMRYASRVLAALTPLTAGEWLAAAGRERSRTRYACMMTAFGL